MLAIAVPNNKWKAFSVATGSMQPKLKPGHLVLVHRVPVTEYNIGDVITFINPNNRQQTITHRIIGISYNSVHSSIFQTKGDANQGADPFTVHETLVIGKERLGIPYAGHVLNFIKSWAGIIVLIYLPALLITCWELKKLITYYRSQVRYVIPGRDQKSVSASTYSLTFGSLLIIGLLIFNVMPALASLNTKATLTGNRISVASSVQNPPDKCQNSTNNNNVTINNNTDQTATSGSANVSNNTSGGSATSGSASNSNSTSVNVNIDNCAND